MRRILILISLLLFTIAQDGICQEKLLKPDFIKNQVAANHSKLVGIKGTLGSFKKYLKTLDTNLISIPYALDYIKTCIPANDTLMGDSVFFYFRNEFNSVVNTREDSIFDEYGAIIKKADTCHCAFLAEVGEYMAIDSVYIINTNSQDVIAFISNLAACGIYLMGNDMDGDRLDAKTDFFYNNFRNRVTKDVRDFLMERQNEITQGFSADGDMQISFDTIYNWAVTWEKFNTSYPKSIFSDESTRYYNTYAETLINQFDDFDEAEVLKPGMKVFWENIIKIKPVSKTKQLISSWYNLLSQHGFNANDSLIDGFNKENNLTRRFEDGPPDTWTNVGK
jgi:hypothetical protein